MSDPNPASATPSLADAASTLAHASAAPAQAPASLPSEITPTPPVSTDLAPAAPPALLRDFMVWVNEFDYSKPVPDGYIQPLLGLAICGAQATFAAAGPDAPTPSSR